MMTELISTNRIISHVICQIAVGFNYETIGCAVSFFDSPVSEEDIATTIEHFSVDRIRAVPVYENDGRLDFFFLFPVDAARLEHPRRALSNVSGVCHFMIVTADEVERLAREMNKLGFVLVDKPSSFVFERDLQIPSQGHETDENCTNGRGQILAEFSQFLQEEGFYDKTPNLTK